MASFHNKLADVYLSRRKRLLVIIVITALMTITLSRIANLSGVCLSEFRVLEGRELIDRVLITEPWLGPSGANEKLERYSPIRDDSKLAANRQAFKSCCIIPQSDQPLFERDRSFLMMVYDSIFNDHRRLVLGTFPDGGLPTETTRFYEREYLLNNCGSEINWGASVGVTKEEYFRKFVE